jgi:hypothetical protein
MVSPWWTQEGFVYSLVRPGPFESSGRRGAGLRRWYWVLLEPVTQYNQEFPIGDSHTSQIY